MKANERNAYSTVFFFFCSCICKLSSPILISGYPKFPKHYLTKLVWSKNPKYDYYFSSFFFFVVGLRLKNSLIYRKSSNEIFFGYACDRFALVSNLPISICVLAICLCKIRTRKKKLLFKLWAERPHSQITFCGNVNKQEC